MRSVENFEISKSTCICMTASCFCLTKAKVHRHFLSWLFSLFKGNRKKNKDTGDEKKHHGAVDESSLEQQFCKLDAITFLCEKSGAILLVLVGLTAGRLLAQVIYLVMRLCVVFACILLHFCVYFIHIVNFIICANIMNHNSGS